MLIVHETMPDEASAVAEALNTAYGIESLIEPISLDGVFTPILEFNAYDSSSINVAIALRKFRAETGKRGMATLILTPRDLYMGDDRTQLSRDDDWAFAYNCGDFSVLSGARMKSDNGQPTDKLHVDKGLYLKRMAVMGVHEVAHDVVHGTHLLPAFWVNERSGHEMRLGSHCPDNTCALYEVVDIKTPKLSEGHLRLGTEKKFDAGLDDVIQRLRPNYLCNDCRSSVKIDANYR